MRPAAKIWCSLHPLALEVMVRALLLVLIVASVLLFSGCTTTPGASPPVMRCPPLPADLLRPPQAPEPLSPDASSTTSSERPRAVPKTDNSSPA